MIFAFVRETKQLTLEEIDRKSNILSTAPDHELTFSFLTEVFSVPTKTFLGYELKVWLPYFIKRHILRQNIMKPPPIIEKAEGTSSDEDVVTA